MPLTKLQLALIIAARYESLRFITVKQEREFSQYSCLTPPTGTLTQKSVIIRGVKSGPSQADPAYRPEPVESRLSRTSCLSRSHFTNGEHQISRRGRGRTGEAWASLTDQISQCSCQTPYLGPSHDQRRTREGSPLDHPNPQLLTISLLTAVIDTQCVVRHTLLVESLLERGYPCGALRKNGRRLRVPAAALD